MSNALLQQIANPFVPDIPGAFRQGQERARQDRSRNALGRVLSGDQSAMPELLQNDPQQGFQVQQYLSQLDEQSRKTLAQNTEMAARELIGVSQIKDPTQRLSAWQQALQRHKGMGLDTSSYEGLDPDSGMNVAASRILPIADLLKQSRGEEYTLTPGAVRFGPGGQRIAEVPPPPQRPNASDSALVPVADPTSPTGFKYARRNEAAGMPAPAPRAQTSGRYSPKELQQARDKIRVLGVAKQQLANLKAQRDKIKDSLASGPGMGALTPLSEAGSNFDAAVDQMRDTITGLTRTPGVGAMSDFETRLSQAKLPTRNEFESSRDLKIQGLEDFINNLESGYLGLLEEGQQPAGGPAPGAVDPQDLMDAADAILNGE